MESFNYYDIFSKSPYTALPYNQNILVHTHYFWEITYSIEGTIINTVNGTDIDCYPLNQIVLLKPGDKHAIINPRGITSETDRHRDVYIHVDKMKKLCDLLNDSLYNELCEQKYIVINAHAEQLSSIEESLRLFNASADPKLLDALHTAIIIQILGIYIKKKVKIDPKYPSWISDFFNNLTNESFLCRNIKSIIADIHYSPGYICREFKKYTGKTMISCLNESRIIYSTVLLQNNELSVLDIAMRLNYNSQSAYINAFKKVYRVSPNQWRKLFYQKP